MQFVSDLTYHVEAICMQVSNLRISNQARTQATRAALIAVGRFLFMEKGYANTSTPEIVAAANVTRGALYHHFADKADLFLAVARRAAEEIAGAIAEQSDDVSSPLDALIASAEAYFRAMAENGRARLLLLDAPSILTPAQVDELSDLAGATELREGIAALLRSNASGAMPVDELTALLSASFDRAALAIASGAQEAPYRSAIELLLRGLAAVAGQTHLTRAASRERVA
jgi:AcrR family transcriptional regulator